MKMGWLIILMIAACLLLTVYFFSPVITTNNAVDSDGPVKNNMLQNNMLKNPIFGEHLQNLPAGQLNISIGNYSVRLLAYVDNLEAGYISAGETLNLKVVEGKHTVKVCSGSLCDSIDVDIRSGVKTSIDLEEKLRRDFPVGSLNVSIGDYNGILPVYIDKTMSGNVSPGKSLTLVLNPGVHSVKICNVDNCFTENVEISPRNLTTIDFGSRLKNATRQADLMISIGGYKAQRLPFYIDNVSAGVISQGMPITIKVDTGVHEIKVCSGFVCIKEQVEVKFGKTAFVDFEEQLKKKAEFAEPTARILDYSVSGLTMSINTEYINPSTRDLTMTVTYSDQYTYINQYHERMSNFVTAQDTRVVRAGNRTVQPVNLYFTWGTDIITSPPVITNISITN